MPDNMTPPEETITAPAATIIKEDETVNSFIKDISQPTAEKHTVNNIEEENPEEIKPAAQPAATAKKMLSAGLSAEIAISCLDGIQSALFTAVANKKMKKRIGDDLEEVELIDEKLKQKTVNLSELDAQPAMLLKYRKYKRMMELMEDIPFTEDEVTKMQSPLEAMIIENGYQMPAWLGFSLVIGDVMVKRVASAIFD